MKKTILMCALAAIVAFSAGWFTSQKVNNVEFLREANTFKMELLNLQDKALIQANVLMNKHDLWDIDGSDEMCDYLELCCRIDSLYYTQL